MSICVVSGEFNPLCVNDIRLIKAAKNHETHVHLVVALKGDNFEEKKEIVESISGVNSVIKFENIFEYTKEIDWVSYYYERDKIVHRQYSSLDIKSDKKYDKFQNFLNYASDTVKDWPDWKKNALGYYE